MDAITEGIVNAMQSMGADTAAAYETVVAALEAENERLREEIERMREYEDERVGQF